MKSISKPKVGYIGLGIMGSAMVANLQKSGYQVVVNDKRVELANEFVSGGAVWASTPREVIEQADVVFTCLPSIAQIEEVALGASGILAGIRSGQAFFEMSTSSPELITRLHEAFSAKGAFVLDAPVSGGAIGARRGRLGIWVGGDKQIFDQYEAVLRVMGDQPIHIGAIGSGLITKLVNNCISQATQAAISEIFVLGVKAGAEPLALWEAMRQGSLGRRRTFDGLIDEYLPAKYDPPHAALRIVHKDMMLATDLGKQLGVPLRFSNLALADIQEAMNRGWSERDCRSVMLLPQERAGVNIKVAPEKIQEVLRRDPPAPSDTKYGNTSTTG